MKRRPRRWRWWAKWAAMFGLACSAAVWALCGFVSLEMRYATTARYVSLSAERGLIWLVCNDEDTEEYGLKLQSERITSPAWDWLPAWDGGWHGFAVIVPQWILVVAGVPLTLWLWRTDGRLPGHCPRCGYDLSGQPKGGAGPCPECGHTPTTPPAQRKAEEAHGGTSSA